MPEDKTYQLNHTKDEFIKGVRDTLPFQYRWLDDDDILSLSVKQRPELVNARFKDELPETPSFFSQIWSSMKEAAYRQPQVGASLYNQLIEFASSGDQVSPELRDRASKFAGKLYDIATNSTKRMMEEDTSLRAVQQWNAQNPFEWGRVFEPSIIGRGMGSVLSSYAQIIPAATLGSFIGGPAGGFLGGYAAGYALESSEEYEQIYRAGKERGWTDEEIFKKAGEGAVAYGAIASVLEVLVPFGVGRSLGLFGKEASKSMFGRFSAKFLKKSMNGSSGSRSASEAMSEVLKENISGARRLLDMTRYTLGESGLEATTEGFQFLAQKAIADKVIDNRDLMTPEWIAEAISDPELSESIFGGFLGGGSMATLGSVGETSGRGGIIEAEKANKIEDPDKREKFITDFLGSNKVNKYDKLAFSKSVMGKEFMDELSNVLQKEPTGEPQTETGAKPTGMPKAETATGPTVLERLINPSLGQVSAEEAQGRSLSDRALDYVLKNKMTKQESEILRKDEKLKTQFYSMIAEGLINQHYKESQVINKDGTPNIPAIRTILTELYKKNAKIEVSESGDLSGTDVTAKLVTTEEEKKAFIEEEQKAFMKEEREAAFREEKKAFLKEENAENLKPMSLNMAKSILRGNKIDTTNMSDEEIITKAESLRPANAKQGKQGKQGRQRTPEQARQKVKNFRKVFGLSEEQVADLSDDNVKRLASLTSQQMRKMKWAESPRNIAVVAKKIIEGKGLSDNDLQLQQIYPSELEREIARQSGEQPSESTVKRTETAPAETQTEKATSDKGKDEKKSKYEKTELVEDESTNYVSRTNKNTRRSDATLAIALDYNTAGERATKKAAGKKYIDGNLDVDAIVDRLNKLNTKVLNIAGNGLSTLVQGGFDQEQADRLVLTILSEIISHPNLKNKIELIVTGGQTGIDEAGAKAAVQLGIPVSVLMPKKLRIRGADGKDVTETREQALKRLFGKVETQPTEQKTTENLTEKINKISGISATLDTEKYPNGFGWVLPIPEMEQLGGGTYGAGNVYNIGDKLYEERTNKEITGDRYNKIIELIDNLISIKNKFYRFTKPEKYDYSNRAIRNKLQKKWNEKPLSGKIESLKNAGFNESQIEYLIQNSDGYYDGNTIKLKLDELLQHARRIEYFTGIDKHAINLVLRETIFFNRATSELLTEEQEESDKTISKLEYTPENITSLQSNEIFVFGSNAEGIHGKGAALTAKQNFGAIQGQAEGLQGQSYAVITKKNWREAKSSSLKEIQDSIEKMLDFAKDNPDKKFLVTKLGSSLAGYKVTEIKKLFENLKDKIPNNVVLPKEYEIRISNIKPDEKPQAPDDESDVSGQSATGDEYNQDEGFGFMGTEESFTQEEYSKQIEDLWNGKPVALKMILNNAISKIKDNRVKGLMQKIYKYINPNTVIKYDTEGRINNNRVAMYDTKTNTVYVNPNITISDNLKGTFLEIIAHESMHAVTASLIAGVANGMVRDKQSIALYEELGRIVKLAISHKVFFNLGDTKTNIAEFVSVLFSNNTLAEALMQIPDVSKKSLYSRFIDFIKRLFRISTTNTLYDSAIDASLKAVDLNKKMEQIDNEKLISNRFYYGSEATEPGQFESDRYGEGRDGELIDPAVFIDKMLDTHYGVYIDDKTYAELIKVMRDNSGLNLRDNNNFLFLEKKLFNTILNNNPDKEITHPPYTTEFRDGIKLWYNKVQSTVDVALSKPKNPDNPLLLVRDSSVVKRWLRTIIVSRFGKLRIIDKPQIKLVSGGKEAHSVIQNFLEGQQNKPFQNKLIYALASDIVEEVDLKDKGVFYTNADMSNFTLDVSTIYSLNRNWGIDYQNQVANKSKNPVLMFFLGTTGDDNSKMMFSVVPKQYANADEAMFDEYVAKEIADGYMTDELALQMKNDAVRIEPLNPSIWAQTIGWHHRMKEIKGKKYLIRYSKKNIANLYKRLKLDVFEGWVPRGMGETKILVIDPETTEFEFVSSDGKVVTKPAINQESGKYRYDGWTMTSRDYFERLYRATGVNTKVLKTVIRYLNPLNGVDYIALKHAEMVPYDNMTIYKTEEINGKTKRTPIAFYTYGKWHDAANPNVTFDRVTSREEAKDVDGAYDVKNDFITLPEDSVRVAFSVDTSAKHAAFPIAMNELFLSDKFFDKNTLAKDYLQAVINYYGNNAKEYLDELYSFRDNPKKLKAFINRRLKRGEVPKELEQYVQLTEDGEALLIPNVIRQIIPMLNNKIIIDGINKMRAFENNRATHLDIVANGGEDLNNGEVGLSLDNEAVVTWLEEEMGEKIDLGDDVSRIRALSNINKWLAENELRLLIHRQPIQSQTKIKYMKVRYVTLGHGQVIHMTEHDILRVLDGDLDGDSVYVEKLPETLAEPMSELINSTGWNQRDRLVELRYFKEGPLGDKVASIAQRSKFLSMFSILLSGRGAVVNAKNILAQIAYKKFEIEYLVKYKRSEFDAVQKIKRRFKIIDPMEYTVMDYWPLDPEFLNTTTEYRGKEMTVRESILQQGDHIIERNGSLYLATTKENEFSILLQAVIDNEKFGLFNNDNLFVDADGNKLNMSDFLLSRMFEIVPDSSDAWVGQGKKTMLKPDFKVLRFAYRAFNMSADRRGRGAGGNSRKMSENIARSEELFSRNFDLDENGKPYTMDADTITSNIKSEIYDEIDALPKRRKDRLMVTPTDVLDVKTNGKITPMEWMMSQVGMRNAIDQSNLMQNGVSLDSVMLREKNGALGAHINTMKQLEILYRDMIGEHSNVKEKVQEIFNGMEFGQRMMSEWLDIFAKRKRELLERGVDKDIIDQITLKAEYNDDTKDFLQKFYSEFEQLTPLGRKASTIWVLKGIRIKTDDGKDSKVFNVMSLPPIYVLDKSVLKMYAIEYAKYAYKPFTKGFKREEGRYPLLTELFDKIESLEGKRCG